MKTTRKPAVIETVEPRLLFAYSGTLDTTFNDRGRLSIASALGHAQTSTIELQPDGRVLIAGIYRESANVSKTEVFRRMSDGTADPTFAFGGGVTLSGTANKLTVTPDGHILVSGTDVQRLNYDGTVDTTFASSGTLSLAEPLSSLVQFPNGRFATIGITPGNPLVVHKFLADGAVDAGFGTAGSSTITIAGGGSATYSASALSTDGSGHILVSLSINNNTSLATFGVARLTSGGSLDGTFGIGGVAEVLGYGLPSTAEGITVANDGVIYQVGNYNYGSDTGTAYLLAYSSDGQHAAISPNGGFATFASDVGYTPDNRPIVVGTSVNLGGAGSTGQTLITLHQFGPVDPTSPSFTLDTGFNTTGVATVIYNGPSNNDSASVGDLGFSMRVQPNGNLVVGGVSDNPDGAASSFNLTRFLGQITTPGTVATITGHIYLDTPGAGTITSGSHTYYGFGVILDSNNNGVYDTGETQVLTDATGRYTFAGVSAGTYHLLQFAPPGATHTQPSGNTYTVTVTGGQTLTGQDFGVRGTASVAGTVFTDTNSNGTQDSGEAARTGVTVYLDFDNNGSVTNGDISYITTSTGTFNFNFSIPGTYFLREVVPAGVTLTHPTSQGYVVVLTAGQVLTGFDFGNH